MAVNDTEKSKEPSLSVRGTLVGLGVWLPDHFEKWLESMADAELNLYGGSGFTMPTRAEEAQIFEDTAKNGVNFAVYALDTMRFIGSTGLFDVEQKKQTAEFGISIIDKEYWGRGYGTEAVRLTVDYGFRFMNLYNIWLDTGSFNTRAVRSYEKAGFKVIGRRRESTIIAGKRYDEVFMDCIATDFASPRPGWFELQP